MLICESFAANRNMAFMYSSFTVCQEELHAYKEKAHGYNRIKIFYLDEHFCHIKYRSDKYTYIMICISC